MAFRKISLERTFNNLVCAFQCFICLFCPRFALLKTGVSNRNLTKKGLTIESFLQKAQKFFEFFFRDPRLKSQILTPHPCPTPFENFSLNTLNSEEKPSVKKPVDRTGRPTGRPAGQPAMILKFTGRVESRKS